MSEEPGSVTQRLLRIAYLVMVTVVTTFLVGIFVVMLVEVTGPSEAAEGRVIERIEGTREVIRCYGQRGRCTTQTLPTYSVVGERADGTGWIAVGEGVYDAMRGERGVIDVETSTITNRVVRLVGNDRSDSEWTIGSSGVVWFTIGALVIWLPLLAGFEWRRRTDFFNLGSFVRSDFVVAVLGVMLGLAGLWYVTWAKTASLDIATSQDLYGDFLADPIGFAAQGRERTDAMDAPGVQLGEFFNAGRDSRLAPVSLDALGEVPSMPDGLVAVPMLQVRRFSASSRDRLSFAIVDESADEIEPVSCPPGVRAFPDPLGVDPEVKGGFVCFPADAEGELQLVAGSGVWATTHTLEYEAAD